MRKRTGRVWHAECVSSLLLKSAGLAASVTLERLGSLCDIICNLILSFKQMFGLISLVCWDKIHCSI